jgi:regulator of protease activity HflC (stomatin/prohibitin superfamily)
VREVNPPKGVLDAMTRQMSAERTRRAAITEAQGQKQAAITLAEGTKEAAILGAEGERQAAILRAEGLSQALDKIMEVGQGLDANTMQLQYLETLKQVGTSDSTKIVIPMELSGIVSGLSGLLTGAAAGATTDTPPAAAGPTVVSPAIEAPGSGPALGSAPAERPESR